MSAGTLAFRRSPTTNVRSACRTWNRTRRILSHEYQRYYVRAMESVTLTQSEQARLQLLNSLLAEQTAILMGVCRRHTRRILAAFRQNGATALVFAPTVGTGPSSSGSTQFTHAMDELGVELILPRALHAKGRVESKGVPFRTGWSPSCVLRELPPPATPTGYYGTSCRASTSIPRCQPGIHKRQTGRSIPPSNSTRSCS